MYMYIYIYIYIHTQFETRGPTGLSLETRGSEGRGADHRVLLVCGTVKNVIHIIVKQMLFIYTNNK